MPEKEKAYPEYANVRRAARLWILLPSCARAAAQPRPGQHSATRRAAGAGLPGCQRAGALWLAGGDKRKPDDCFSGRAGCAGSWMPGGPGTGAWLRVGGKQQRRYQAGCERAIWGKASGGAGPGCAGAGGDGEAVMDSAASQGTRMSQGGQDLEALANALSSGDLSGAQQAFAALQQDLQNVGRARQSKA